METPDSVVAVFADHTAAETAIKNLTAAGFDMKNLSLVGKGYHTEEKVIGFYNVGDRIKVWGGQGAFWGSLWGILFGGAFLFIPALGPIVVMGPLVTALVGALEGAAVGGTAGALVAALTSLGIPKESVVKYEVEVKAGKFLILGHGTADLIEKARGVLGTTGASQLTAHAG